MKIQYFFLAALMVSASYPATAVDAELSNDLFIGTIEVSDQQAVLSRCDLGQSRYVLVDDDGQKERPVRDLTGNAQCNAQRCYGVVIGSYREDGSGGHQLVVSDIQDLTPGKSCHLLEALDGLFEEQELGSKDPSDAE